MSRILRLLASCGLVAALSVFGLAFGGVASASVQPPSCMISSSLSFQTIATDATGGVADPLSFSCSGVTAFAQAFDVSKGWPTSWGFTALAIVVPFSGGWLGIHANANGATFPDSFTVSLPAGAGLGTCPNIVQGSVEVQGSGWCLGLGESLVEPTGFSGTVPQFQFANLGSTATLVDAGENGVPYYPPCDLTSLTGPAQPFNSDSYSFAFTTAGTQPVDSVVAIPTSPLVFTSAPSDWFASYNLPGTSAPSSSNGLFLISPFSTSFSLPLDLSSSDATSLNPPTLGTDLDFVLYCFDGVQWYSWGSLGSSTTGGGSGSGGASFGSCFANSSIGLNPSSWVPALVNMVGCALQSLFVPPQSSIQSLTNVFGITSNDPGGSVGAAAWLGSMVRIVASAPASEVAAIKTVADNASCFANAPSAPSMTVAGHSIGVCAILSAPSSLASNSMPGWIAFIKDVLTVVIYGGAGLLLFGLLRRVLGGS